VARWPVASARWVMRFSWPTRGVPKRSDLAAETGATAVSVPEAVRGVDLVVVTIPEKNIPSLPAGLFAETPDRVVVVDTGNYYPRQRDGRIEPIEAGLPESQWVAQQLGRPVIKAFNNIYARHLLELGRPKGTAGRIASSSSSMNWALTASMLEGWMSPGGNSPARQSMPRTSTPRACGVLCPRPTKTANRNGAAPLIAPQFLREATLESASHVAWCVRRSSLQKVSKGG
jgi:NADP oxidoreductase coenzyme F420-dependent